MFKLNSIFKIVIVMFLSLVIPSFLSIFKISFDEYVAAQKSDVQGASVVRVQTVNKNQGTSKEQSVLLDFALPKVGAINNLSQKPFKFPKPQQTPVSAPVNNHDGEILSYPTNVYDFSSDKGRGGELFYFTYGGVIANRIAFNNGNDYDMNDVRIEVKWVDGTNTYVSVYSVFKIQKKQSYNDSVSNTAEATIPYNPTKVIKSITLTFKDNAGSSFSAKV